LFVAFLLPSTYAKAGSTTSLISTLKEKPQANFLGVDPIFPTNATFETKAEVVGNTFVLPVGGLNGSNYYGQSFKALADYVVNGGLYLHSWVGQTPNFRILLCNKTSAGWPNVTSPMAISEVVSNVTIDAAPGRYYLNLTTPVRVQQNETYWLVIDGYYDHTTPGGGQSSARNDNPYHDGYATYSNNAGVSWTMWGGGAIDLDFIVTFSSRPNKAEVVGTDLYPHSVGGSGTDYYAQSFKALDSYIVDAGVWIGNYSGTTPNLRVQIWGNNDSSGYPDKSNVIASSRVIIGSEIGQKPGRFFVYPNVSIPVVVGQTYWLVIDGYYDNVTSGSAESRGAGEDNYEDGQYLYSNDVGVTWDQMLVVPDLDFVVTFSSSRSAIKVSGRSIWTQIGGTGTLDYAGQSFKALNKYMLDAGVWLENNTNLCPDTRLLICKPTQTGFPNVTNPITASIPIRGIDIMNNPGWFYLHPPEPIDVAVGQTYFLIIDGLYDNTTNGNIKTLDRSDNPYDGGMEYYSTNAGASWLTWSSYDLSMDITFSDVPGKAQCGSNDYASYVGGSAITPYFAQSFIALNDYIADAGIWLENGTLPTPDFRILLCENNATGYDHPNLNQVLAETLKITGTTIDASPGLYYVKPPVSIPVTINQMYWIVIDGLYYNASTGRARSRSVNYDAYPDGQFLWAYANLNLGWHPDVVNSRYDLDFEVTFTHVNQPPTQPQVAIVPAQPFDSDNLVPATITPSTDFEQESIYYYVEWFKDGVMQPAYTGSSVPSSATAPMENWQLRVTPYDPHMNGTSAFYDVTIQSDIETIDHSVVADSQTFHVFTTSNSTITAFNFNQAGSKITFTATGPNGGIGSCNITIPKTLMDAPWLITINGTAATPTITGNTTHTIIQLIYSTSSVSIEIHGLVIVPEFTMLGLLVSLAGVSVAVAAIKKRITKKRC
jgi:hypothetical protein